MFLTVTCTNITLAGVYTLFLYRCAVCLIFSYLIKLSAAGSTEVIITSSDPESDSTLNVETQIIIVRSCFQSHTSQYICILSVLANSNNSCRRYLSREVIPLFQVLAGSRAFIVTLI